MGADNNHEDSPRRGLWGEILIVVLVTFGTSALSSLLAVIDMVLAAGGIAGHRVTLHALVLHNAMLDSGNSVVYGVHLIAFAALALLLLSRDQVPLSRRGADRVKGRDIGYGVALAAIIGLPGLALYVGAHHMGLAATVQPVIDYPLWRTPEFIFLSLANGIAEEVVVVGYLITRLTQWNPTWCTPVRTVWVSALLRGCYHLYQGPAAGIGNVVMGLLFGGIWLRHRRLVPLIVAHTVIDCVAFIGYPLLHGQVNWLP